MSWYSLLPAEFTAFEGWMTRIFVILGTLTIVPWIFLVLYDILLYAWRATLYEIPIVGGRARGRRRPDAPSLGEIPGRTRRALSLTSTTSGSKEIHPNGGDGASAASVGGTISSKALAKGGSTKPVSPTHEKNA